MKKFDWFTILGMLAIAENTILMIAQGGWLTVAGLIFGGIWVWVAYWDWKHKQKAKMFDLISRYGVDLESTASCLRTLGSIGCSMEEANIALRQHGGYRGFIGDASCKWNARSPHLRCAINPCGECQGCKDYEKV